MMEMDSARIGERTIGVVGLGYVGLPLAVAFGSVFRTIGFDVSSRRIEELRHGKDHTGEVLASELEHCEKLSFTEDESMLRECDFVVICVPTPVDDCKRPDLRPLLAASATVGRNLRNGACVVFESTVYPGCTEEDCLPVLESASGKRLNVGFHLGYSPERINPGDREHTFRTIRKVVSGSSAAALDLVDAVYSRVVEAGTFRASSIRVAEAAKVIENAQRDLNIAFVNELALIFHRLDIDVGEVLEAAGTKWNFLPFRPGLVGGHCIGVDPYYLTHKALQMGYHPEVILAGRKINDGMGSWIAHECVRLMMSAPTQEKLRTVLVLGITFKENVGDIRNTKVVDIIRELSRFDVRCHVVDPLADPEVALEEYGIEVHRDMDGAPPCSACVAAVPHHGFFDASLVSLGDVLPQGAPVLDIKGVLDRRVLETKGLVAWRL